MAAVVDDSFLAPLRALGVETVVHGDVADGTTGVSRATLGAWNSDVLAAQIAGLISGIELIDPPTEVSARLATIGTELVTRFGERPASPSGHAVER